MGTVANVELMRKMMKNCVAKKGWARVYFQAWLTASEMLQDHGCEIEDDDGSTDLLSCGKYGEFIKRYYKEEEEGEGGMDLEDLNIIAAHRSDPTNKVGVNFLARHRNVNLGVVHAICDAFEAENIRLSRVILVGHNCSLIVERSLVPRDNYTVQVEIFDVEDVLKCIMNGKTTISVYDCSPAHSAYSSFRGSNGSNSEQERKLEEHTITDVPSTSRSQMTRSIPKSMGHSSSKSLSELLKSEHSKSEKGKILKRGSQSLKIMYNEMLD